MFRKIAPLVIHIAVLCGLLASCACPARKITPGFTPTDLRTHLQSSHTPVKQDPFVIRSLNPNLDGKWIGQAVSYGCYRQNQAPWAEGPSKTEILEDLQIIQQHWNLIRVYNADDDTQHILEVIREHKLPIRVMLGIWLENEDNKPVTKRANTANVQRGIELCNMYPDLILAVSVGNETQVFWSGHKMTSASLLRYIRFVRNYTSVPVTTADDYSFWNKPESQTIANEVDFIVTHIYPLWNGKTLQNAIEWLDITYKEVSILHPDRSVVLGEIGWATDYNRDKTGDGEQGTLIKGDVSVKAQEVFLTELDAWIFKNKIVTFLFEVFDEPWKGGADLSGNNEIEKNWGVFYTDRNPKTSFTNYLSNKKLKDNPPTTK
jgi:exo-beta-1,3-glucanase (GH17 family)